MNKTLGVVSVVSASVLGTVVACKKTTTEKKNYPIVDERGDLPVVGTLAGNLQSPFSADIFDDKTCASQHNIGSVQNVSVRMKIDEVADDLNKPRVSMPRVIDIDSVLSFTQGRLSSTWFDQFASRLGEVSNGKIDLNEYDKKEAGVLAARSLIDSDNFKRSVTIPAKQFMPCDELKDGRMDLTTGRSRVHAAFGVAALLGREVKFLESHVAAGAPLFPRHFQVSPFGLNVLGEQLVDYNFVAPDANGVKTRFYQRYAAVDNMTFGTKNDYSETLSGSELRASRRFIALPHSTFFANEFLVAGAFYKTPFALQHEFGHLIFAESVRRAISVSMTENSFSFAKAAMFVPKVLMGLDEQKSHIDMRDLRGRGGHFDSPVATSQSIRLLDGANSQNLTGSDRTELVRRVDYIFRAVEEAYADFYALARSAHYGGFRMGCIGTDRDPRVEHFGVGTGFQLPKRIPAGIHLTEYLGDENSWKSQAVGDENVLLSERNECTGRPHTLQRPYVLAGILTHWLHEGLGELFSKRFVDLNESARVDFVLASVEALKQVWMPWTTMVDEGFHKGRFSSFTDSRSDAQLLSIVNQVSLQKSLQAVLAKLFSSDASGWYNRHRAPNGLAASAALAKMCELAKVRGVMKGC